MPKISVIMSVYKEPIEWIKQSVDSILNQTFKDFEFIIVNDKPERSENNVLLSRYEQSDKRIRIVHNDKNIGLTKSLNKGLSIAKGEYIARMDADDISVPERFEKQVRYMESYPEIGVCGSAIEYIGCRSGYKTYPENVDTQNILLESPFAHPSVMIRKSALAESKYNEDFRYSQDFELWVSLYSKSICFHNLQEPLLKYRISDEQIMAKHGKDQLDLSCSLRRRAYNSYMKLNGLSERMPEDDLYYKHKPLLVNHISDNDIKEFLFYLYCSFHDNGLVVLIMALLSGDCSRIGLINTLRLFKYKVLGRDAIKY